MTKQSRKAVSRIAAELGRLGGRVTGPSKRRGDAAFYAALARSGREEITVRNDFHGTEVRLRPRDGWLSPVQARRAHKALCPSRAIRTARGWSGGCSCGGVLGQRGPQEWKIVDERQDGSVRVAPRVE